MSIEKYFEVGAVEAERFGVRDELKVGGVSCDKMRVTGDRY